MMNIDKLIEDIYNNNISLNLVDDKDIELVLVEDFDMKDDLLENIKTNKLEIVKKLRDRNNYSVTPFQKGLLSFLMNNPESDRYIIDMKYNVDQKIEFNIFKDACEILVQRHEILRTKYSYDFKKDEFISKVKISDYLFCKSITNEEFEINKKNIFRFDIEKETLIKFYLIDDSFIVILIHHAIIDLVSMGLLLEELKVIFINLLTNLEPVIENSQTVNIPFAEYAVWLKTKNSEGVSQYWSSLLKNKEPFFFRSNVSLKKDDNSSTFHQRVDKFILNKESMEFIRKNNLTFSTVINFLAAYSFSVYSYVKQDFIWGNLLTHRFIGKDGFDKIIGPCITNIPLIFNFADKLSLKDALLKFQQQLSQSFDYSKISLDEICKLNNKKELFNILFSVQVNDEHVNTNERTESMNMELSQVNNITSHFPITLLFNITNGSELEIKSSFIEYNISEEQLIKILNYTVSLYNSIGSYLDKDISLIYKEEEGFNWALLSNITEDNGNELSIVDMWNDSLRLHPEKIAVSFLGNSITYQELDRKSNCIANNFIKNNIYGTVAIAIPNSADLIIAVLGILKTGCRIVYLNHDLSAEKNNWLLKNLDVKAIIFNQNVDYDVDENIFHFNLSDGLLEEDLLEERNIDPEDICVYHYTSGSTGTPKIVKASHRSFVNRFQWLLSKYPAKENDVYCYKTMLSFAPAIREIFEPLLQGAKLEIIPETHQKDLNKFVSLLHDAAVTRVFLTPTFLLMLLDTKLLKAISNIRILEISGEYMSVEKLIQISEILYNTTILNRYGCTEVASVVYFDVENIKKYKSIEYSSPVPLGKPIDNTIVRVVDENFNDLPINVVGEISLSSKSTASGYFNEADNQFAENSTFRTGDFGYIDSEGNLNYCGRKSRMVKIRGYRIEPTEIEYYLERFPDVKKAHIEIMETKFGFKLYAFCATDNTEILNESNIKFYLKDKIPSYMIPNRIFVINDIPTTRNNKIDATKLKNLYARKDEIEDPKTNTQKSVFEIISVVLAEEEISINDDIFNLGIDSISIMKIVHQIKLFTNIDIPGSILYDKNTIKLISEYIDDLKKGDIIISERNDYYVVQDNMENDNYLFLIPPLTGCSIFYKTMKPFVPSKLNFIIFDGFDLDRYKDLSDSLENMASFFVNIIEEKAKGKKIHLAGWSFGGTITFEVAIQLQKKGFEIHSLILMDPGFKTSDYDDGKKSKQDYVDIVKKLIEIAGGDPEAVGAEKMGDKMFHANNLIINYKPRIYKGDIRLIKPKSVSDFERNYGKKYNGLENFTDGKIEVSTVPGNHMTMTSGPVKQFSKFFFRNINLV